MRACSKYSLSRDHSCACSYWKKNDHIILVQNQCFMVPNAVLLIYKWQINHDLVNATKLQQIVILNFHAPLLISCRLQLTNNYIQSRSIWKPYLVNPTDSSCDCNVAPSHYSFSQWDLATPEQFKVQAWDGSNLKLRSRSIVWNIKKPSIWSPVPPLFTKIQLVGLKPSGAGHGAQGGAPPRAPQQKPKQSKPI